MKIITKGIVGLAVVAAMPAAAAILEVMEPAALRSTYLAEGTRQTSIHEKDQSRFTVVSAATDALAKSGSLVQLAQAHLGEGGRMPLASPGSRRPFPPPFPPGEGPESLPSRAGRAVCEEEVNRKSALAGYFKSKLRLQGPQRDAWQKLEQAADAAIERLHEGCDRLPTDASAPPNVVESIDLVVRQLSADVEFLLAIREPLRAVYEQLSPQQRLMLQPPGPARIAL